MCAPNMDVHAKALSGFANLGSTTFIRNLWSTRSQRFLGISNLIIKTYFSETINPSMVSVLCSSACRVAILYRPRVRSDKSHRLIPDTQFLMLFATATSDPSSEVLSPDMKIKSSQKTFKLQKDKTWDTSSANMHCEHKHPLSKNP